MVEKAKKGAAKSGAVNYVRGVEDKVAENYVIKGIPLKGGYKVEGNKIVNGESEIELTMKGDLPEEGTICLDQKGKVTNYSVLINGYSISKVGSEEKTEQSDKALNISCNVENEAITFDVAPIVWSTSKNITIIYPELEGIEKLYKIGNGEWQNYSEPFTITSNTTIYARLYDGRNASSAASLVVSKIDKNPPTLAINTLSATSKKLEIPYTVSSNYEITNATCEYGTSELYGSNGTIENNKCTISEISPNTTYYYKICTTAANEKTSCVESLTYLGATCIEGYSLVDSKCQKTISIDAEEYYVCSDEYTLDETKCTMDESADKISKTCSTRNQYCVSSQSACPGGNGWDNQQCGFECVYYSYYDCSYCPEGYTDNGTNCKKTTSIDATIKYRCTDDYYLDETSCKKDLKEEFTANLSCPTGYTDSNNICIK